MLITLSASAKATADMTLNLDTWNPKLVTLNPEGISPCITPKGVKTELECFFGNEGACMQFVNGWLFNDVNNLGHCSIPVGSYSKR